MATAEQTLNYARQFLGEGPQRFVDWYGSGATYSTPWCCIFQSFVLTNSGAQPTHYAWVSGLFDAMRAQGRCTTDVRSAKPGDLVAFSFSPSSGPNNRDHIAMVAEVNDRGPICVNGNWENRVQLVQHYWSGSGYQGGIAELARPFYDNPSPAHQGVDVYQYARTKDDRIVLFGVGPEQFGGLVAHRWQDRQNGGFSDWHSLGDGQPFNAASGGITAERNADGRFEVMIWDAAGNVAYRTQNADTSWRPWRREL